MGQVRVRAYQRSDGTAVRSHDRRGFWGKLFRRSGPPKGSLDALVEPLPSERVELNYMHPAKVLRAADRIEEPRFFGGLSDFRRLGDRSLTVGAAVVGGGVTAASAGIAFMFAAPVIGVAVAGVAAAALVGSAITEQVVFRSMMKHRFRKWKKENKDPSKEQLDAYCEQYDWKTQGKKSLTFAKGGKPVLSSVSPSGWGKVSWTVDRNNFNKDIMKFRSNVFFFPGVNLEEMEFPSVSLPGVNLEGANLSHSQYKKCNFDGANFKGVDFSHSYIADGSAKNADFRGANLEWADLSKCDLRGADLRGAKLWGSLLPSNLDNVVLGSQEFESLRSNNVSNDYYTYSLSSFDDAAKTLGVTDSQFEYLVLSGVVEVRDNRTKNVVTGDFNPDWHHVPSWSLREAKKSLNGSR